MTTRVTIKNEESSGHSIEVKFAGHTAIVAPGDSVTSFVWEGNGMKVRELPFVMEAETNDYAKLAEDGLRWVRTLIADGLPQFSDIQESEATGKAAYEKYTANDPLVHCNRFASWDELTPQNRQEWIDKVKA